ncbi:MAG: Imm50 family immunity protein [Pirellulales bacterium]
MWWELAVNPRNVTAYYASPPDLRGVEVSSVCIHRWVELLIELPVFPDKPSRRWHPSCNAATANLRFFGFRNVQLDNWGFTNKGDINLKKVGNTIEFSFQGESNRLFGCADCFDVEKITGYCKEVK